MKNTIQLNGYKVTFERNNQGEIAAYVNDAEESSIAGTADEVIEQYLDDARNSECGEDALYEAVNSAK